MSKFGVDISNHNGKINFAKLRTQVSFCMIRAGYSKTIDERFAYNAEMCEKYNIPYGVYWFSYATSDKDIEEEAKACYNAIKNFKITLPVAFDWEYDSDIYFKKINGKSATNNERNHFARLFCEKIKKFGYEPMIYTNCDYYSKKGFYGLEKQYPIWLAHWGVSSPKYSCKMWQYSSTGTVDGINGYVDLNRSYIDDKTNNDNKDNAVKTVCDKYNKEYIKIAEDIIKGVYGNGAERKKKIKALGYDYDFAQAIVNALVM